MMPVSVPEMKTPIQRWVANTSWLESAITTCFSVRGKEVEFRMAKACLMVAEGAQTWGFIETGVWTFRLNV